LWFQSVSSGIDARRARFRRSHSPGHGRLQDNGGLYSSEITERQKEAKAESKVRRNYV
jgi:hypothetical protein